MADITIGIVASAREWRSVLQAHVRDHVAGVRVQILREPRMALELDLDVVVIDDVSSFLTRDKVIRLREKGTRVVGIYDPDGNEGLGITFLENLGVDLSLPSNISPEEMINAVSQMQPRENYGHTFDHIVADFSTGETVRVGETQSALIAVSGPSGTGSTEIAIALADILVARRETTLLLDCDEVGPSVARRLGFHLHPNILSAIDAVSNVTHPLTEMVGRPGDRVASAVNFDVLPGIANAEDWAQLRSMDIEDLFAAARKSWRYIVCNTGPFVEDLSGYGIERFGATRATLEAADVIIGVMSPTPTGYMRFLDWMASIRTLGADRSVFIVVNNAPKSSYIRGEIENQLSRDVDSRFFAGLFFVPQDDRVVKAEWEGQRVARGPFVTGVAEIASYALPMAFKKGKQNQQLPVQNFGAAPTSSDGYTPSYEAGPGPQAPVSVSWNDPDIANPPVAPMPPVDPTPPALPISLDEPPETFYDLSNDHVSDVAQIEESLTQSMAAQPEQYSTQAAAPSNAQPYSYSPPEHAVEQFPAAPPVAAPSAVPDTGQGYTPSYTHDEQEDNQANTYVPAPPAPPVDPSMYTPDAADMPSPEPEPASGYVPHFLDEKKNDHDDDSSFWSE